MSSRTLLLGGAIMALLGAAIPTDAGAQWLETGAPVCSHAGAKADVCALADGAGGLIVAWADLRSASTWEVYAQHLDGHGDPLWTVDGVLVDGGYQTRRDLAICSDGAGGAIIVWEDYRNGNWDIYGRRIAADGTAAWGAAVPICALTGTQEDPAIVADGSGGAIVAWTDDYSGHDDIYAQRLDAAGNVLWTVNGEPVCMALGFQSYPEIASDLAGGAYVAWRDFRTDLLSGDLYLQRISAAGAALWATDGVAVVTEVNQQYGHHLLTHVGGGVSIIWSDNRSGGYDIYAQRYEGDGDPRWTAGGALICSTTDVQSFPYFADDGAGGFIAAWRDYRSGSGFDVYAQRVGPSGTALWTSQGVAVCALDSDQYPVGVVSDLAGGAVVTWLDDRYDERDLFAQRLDATGKAMWDAGGVAVLVRPGDQAQWAVTGDDAGGALAATMDLSGGEMCVAQRVERNGYWGYPAPRLHAAVDVPGDQGGLIDLSWYASRLDPYPEMEILEYTVWKSITADKAASLRSTDAAGTVRVEVLGDKTWFWRLVATLPAHHLQTYSLQVPTEFDSTAASPGWHHFQVLAHDGGSAFWISPPDSGRSVDNLAPAALLGLEGRAVYAPAGLAISWRPAPEPDLQHYALHRGPTPDFVPGPENLVAVVPDTLWFDPAWKLDLGYHYLAAAVDLHDNVGPYALLSPSELTGAEPSGTPSATRLVGNVPNPFNPATEIRYELGVAGPVRLLIFDSAGRLVRTVLDGRRQAGVHAERWDGRDDGGRPVAAGVYHCRLETGGQRQARKLVLVR